MYVYCVYPAMIKNPKQQLNYLKMAETSVILIVFNGVLCEVGTSTVTVSYCCSTYFRNVTVFPVIVNSPKFIQFACSNRSSAG